MNYEKIKTQFETSSDKERAVQMSAYMRNQFDFYGITSPKRKDIYKDDLKAAKRTDCIDWSFLDACWNDHHREFQYLAIDYLSAMQKVLTYSDTFKIKKYIQSKQWWDTIDGLDRIVGNIAFVDKRIDYLMLEWSKDPDFWVRRVAIDHQLNRKWHTNTELLAQIVANNFGSKEFFINKAIGWSLRDYSKTDPEWVRKFIDTHRNKMDKLSLREAGKYI